MDENRKIKVRKNDLERFDLAERRRKALELRKAGVDYLDIARAVGLKTAGGAYKLVHAALKATYREPADDVRKMELERLDRLMLGWWKLATGTPPNTDATDRVLKIMDRRAKLMGLDAAVKIEDVRKVYEVGNSPEDLWQPPPEATRPGDTKPAGATPVTSTTQQGAPPSAGLIGQTGNRPGGTITHSYESRRTKL